MYQKNRISNYMCRYGIVNNVDNFNQIAEEINKKEYFIYWKILLLLENCRIIEENSYSIIAEIDSEEYRYLLEDITKKFFTKIIKRTRLQTQKQVIGNLFFTTIIIYK